MSFHKSSTRWIAIGLANFCGIWGCSADAGFKGTGAAGRNGSGNATAGVGTPVTLWGHGLSADEVAAAAGTVSYELLCAVAPRVPVIEA